MKKILALLLVFSLLFPCFSAITLAADDKDFEIILERIQENIIANPSCQEYDDSWVNLIGADGTFSDLDYTDRNGRFDHIKRITSMAWQYALEGGKLYKQQDVLNKINAGFSFFVNQKYTEVGSSGNWSSTLESPQYMAEVVIALRYANASVSQSLIDIMEEHHFDLHMRTTGNAITFALNTSNLAYTSSLWQRIALVLHDDKYINWMYDYSTAVWTDHTSGEYGVVSDDAKNDTRLSDTYFGDGYYPDGSYMGHGNQNYVFGYGNQFIAGNVNLVKLAAGTKYQPEQKKLEVLVNVVLNSMRWLMRGDNCDFPALGRSLSGTDNGGTVTNGRRYRTINYIKNLLYEPNIPRRAELEDFLAKLESNEDMSYVSGNRHMWLTDIMTHHREKYFTTANLASTRKFKAERVGAGGINNYYISDGTAPIYVTGHEYEDAIVVWDWDRLPGLTTIQTDGDVPGLVDMSSTASEHYGRTDFAGGASDGTYGVAGMDYVSDLEVTAKKAYFYFDDEFVHLGAGVSSKSNDELYTSINQCILDGAVTYSNGTEEAVLSANTKLNVPNAKWVYHGNIGYVLPKEQNVYIANEAQTGNGGLKNDTSLPSYTRDVFSMYINHGSKVKDETYSYIAVPGATIDEVRAYVNDIPVEIVANTPKVQAVYHKKLDMLQAVFYEAGELTLENGMTVSVDTPCITMFKRQEGGMAVTVQNPTNEHIEIGVTINEKFESDRAVWNEKEGKSSLTAINRNGLYVGESVNINITSKLISNIAYNAETDELVFDGIIPTSSARYIFAKITDKNGESIIKSAEINSDSTYEFTVDALDFSAGKYTIELYCENDMETLVSELDISKEKPVAPVIFPDTTYHWVRDYAARLAVHGVIEGDENGNCNPDEVITLAEIMKILVKTAEIAGVLETPYVQEGEWDVSVMNYAKVNGFIPEAVLALGENPSRLITRQEMVTLVMQVAEKFGLTSNLSETGGELPADAATANHWAYNALEKAYKLEIIHGDGIGINPFGYSTRGECIKILDVIINSVIN